MKRSLWLIILAAVIIAGGVAVGRWRIESPNKTVEIIYDLDGVREVSETQQIPLASLLADLKEVGVTTIALQPENLGEWLLQNKPLDPEILTELPEQISDLGRFLLLPVAFRPNELEVAQVNGFNIAPKLNTVPWRVEPLWLASDPKLVILSGQGEYPLEHLYGYDGRLALVEFSAPKISHLRQEQVVRLHGISALEMRVLPTDRILNRYIRGVRERNIRVLYVRPFVEGANSWQRSLDLVEELSGRLEQEGFVLGVAQPFEKWQVSPIPLALIALGIWAAVMLYCGYLFPRLKWLIITGGVGGWLITLVLIFVRPLLAKQGLALLTTLVFPPLALQVMPGKNARMKYLGVAAVSGIGALFIVATLGGTEFLVKIQEFRGVKVAHVIPIALVAFTLIRPIKDWLRGSIPNRYLIWAGLLGLAGVLYILRTGNFGLPVPAWEVQARELLENLLGARPRTKEFLVGHPALYLALQSKRPKKSWWLPIAVVGQISLINTFTHTHTFLGVSIVRTVYGLVFGYLLGWLAANIIALGKRWLASDLGSRLLRIW